MDSPTPFLRRLSPRARAGLVAGLLVIVALVAALSWWIFRPRYGLLFGHLRQTDAASIVHMLDQWHVPYRIADGGTSLQVPTDQIYATRMKLASSNVPHGGTVGFELFDHADYGVTEFAQHVNYLRALQGELERTIDSLAEVDSARVHLTLQQTGLFTTGTTPAKGSVTVRLRPGRHLDTAQVIGIQRLVASAVEGLKPGAVVVLDQTGNVLSASGDGNLEATWINQPGRERQLEDRLTQRADALLHDALHDSTFTVSVHVQLNYDRVKDVRDELLAQGRDGNGLVVSETRSQVPGGSSAASGSEAVAVRSTDIKYAHGREQRETEVAPGRVERVTVGIVVAAPLSQETITKLKDVVAAGLGLDAKRGDVVDIASFVPVAQVASPHGATRTSAFPKAAHSHPVAAVVRPVGANAGSVTNRSRWIVPGLVVATGILVLLLAGPLWRRRTGAGRLSTQERELALARVRQWIKDAESMT